jgi:hypothetical protein
MQGDFCFACTNLMTLFHGMLINSRRIYGLVLLGAMGFDWDSASHVYRFICTYPHSFVLIKGVWVYQGANYSLRMLTVVYK